MQTCGGRVFIAAQRGLSQESSGQGWEKTRSGTRVLPPGLARLPLAGGEPLTVPCHGLPHDETRVPLLRKRCVFGGMWSGLGVHRIKLCAGEGALRDPGAGQTVPGPSSLKAPPSTSPSPCSWRGWSRAPETATSTAGPPLDRGVQLRTGRCSETMASSLLVKLPPSLISVHLSGNASSEPVVPTAPAEGDGPSSTRGGCAELPVKSVWVGSRKLLLGSRVWVIAFYTFLSVLCPRLICACHWFRKQQQQ